MAIKRMQLFFDDDNTFMFIKRRMEFACLVEMSGELVKRAWKHFFSTQKNFPGYKKIPAGTVTLSSARDIILDPFNQVPAGESITQKPGSVPESIKKWIAKVAENQRFLYRGKRRSTTISEWVIIGELCVFIMFALAIVARFAFARTTPHG